MCQFICAANFWVCHTVFKLVVKVCVYLYSESLNTCHIVLKLVLKVCLFFCTGNIWACVIFTDRRHTFSCIFPHWQQFWTNLPYQLSEQLTTGLFYGIFVFLLRIIVIKYDQLKFKWSLLVDFIKCLLIMYAL